MFETGKAWRARRRESADAAETAHPAEQLEAVLAGGEADLEMDPPELSHSETRQQIVTAAVAEWTRRLVNLDGHNRMLYFRELRRGTLEISTGREGVRAAGVEHLLTAGSASLNEMFAPDALPDAALRILALAGKARSNFEEKGLSTLYLGHSFATWTRPDGHVPRAPVALLPVRIRVVGPGGHDAVVIRTGPAEVNPSFVHAMAEDLGRDPYPDIDETPDDYRAWLDHIARACTDIPDFELDERVFIANFEFSKLPMVADLEQHIPLLLDNDVVAAIAGDAEARRQINLDLAIRPDLPDRIDPEDEFLVCDADASQSHAIAAALGGQSLAVHGPPGTGKSQTIANLISSMAAAGKTVLFVAEKRAAIAAVTRRLQAAGCSELVLDLHDGTGRRHVVKSLDESFRALANFAGHDEVLPHSILASARKKLTAHRRQMHIPREPHGLSFFELQAIVGTPDDRVSSVRLSGGVLDRWTKSGRAEALGLVAHWQQLADQLDGDQTGMWAGSHIRNVDDAAQAKAAVDRLMSQHVPEIDVAYQAALGELGLPADTDLPVFEFSEYLTELNELVTRHGTVILEHAESLMEELAPADRPALGRLLARLTNSRYRRAMKDLTGEGSAVVRARTVLADARRVGHAQQRWRRWFPSRPMPTRADAAPRLADAIRTFTQVRDELVNHVPALAGLSAYVDQEQTLRAMNERLDLADARAKIALLESSIGGFGLGPVLRDSTVKSRQNEELARTADKVFAASAIGAITWQEPELAMFTGKSHDVAAADFAKLDRRHIESTAPRVMKLVAERATAAMRDQTREVLLLRHEIETGAHQMPVRQLLSSVPHIAKALRPCWAMSPLLVSRLLPATKDMFDIVIFDEGSQVLPVHAIPAIARGSQVLVAGDPHQLPPADFRPSESPEDEADGEHRKDPTRLAADAESILDVMRTLVPERRLLWHYRSHDERLINFSNTHIYDRSLITFPGTNKRTGVRHVFVDGLPATKAGTSSNPEVVARVVDLILDHARKRPTESLGVIALGLRHANDVARALRIARLELDEDFGGFFAEKGDEPFFIKVMTDAQGDERDHIILSIGLGRTPQGDMAYRWGDLNRRGGERRLNVAVTRAKRLMTVVTSIKSGDIDRKRARSAGAAMLRHYLEYAEAGGFSQAGPDTGELNAFEISVQERLSAAGIPVEPHYGGGPLRIDFAAMDGKFTDQPILAIETDGLGYNSSHTARDRDRLRLEVLAKRGWQHHRIWSADWYRDPAGETAKVKEVWESAAAALSAPEAAKRTEGERPVVAGRGRSPIAIRRTGILGYERDELVQLIRWIESDGIERGEDELMRTALEVLSLQHTPSNHRAERALRGAIAQARST